MNQIIPNRAVQLDPAHSERVITTFCEHTGLPRRETFTAEQVVELLDAMGYRITLGTILEFHRKQYVSEPISGVWNDMFVHALAAALECRRRWQKYPNPVHDAKKSAPGCKSNRPKRKAGRRSRTSTCIPSKIS